MSKRRRTEPTAKSKSSRPPHRRRKAAGQEPSSAHSAWERFAARYPRRSALEEGAVYALPTGLVEAIQVEMPGFLTAEEAQFECDLAEAAGTGFFLRQPFRYPLLDSHRDNEKEEEMQLDEFGRRARRSTEAIHQMLVDDMRQSGLSEPQIEAHFAEAEVMQEHVLQRQRGYAGWLVTHAEYRRRCDEFRDVWGTNVEQDGRLPRLPFSFTGTHGGPVAPADREFYAAYTGFYQDWGLDRLQTWDLPLPMRAELVKPSLYPVSQVSEAGLLLLVPWYLLRDKDVRLHDLAAHRRTFERPVHLDAWLDGKPKNWGHDRFALMLELYVYIELGVKRRYAARLSRKIGKLDQALGRYFCARIGTTGNKKKPESVTKVRQEMNRRLRAT